MNKSWETSSGPIQAYITYKDGRPAYNTGFPEPSNRCNFSLNKGDPRPRPEELTMIWTTSLSFTKREHINKMSIFPTAPSGTSFYNGAIRPVCGTVAYLPYETWVERKAVSDLLKKIQDSSANVLQNLGEGKRTIESAASIARYMLTFHRSLPKTIAHWFANQGNRSLQGYAIPDRNGVLWKYEWTGVGRKRRKTWTRIPKEEQYLSVRRESDFTKDMASLLLTFDYGIRPLIADFFKAADTLGSGVPEGQKLYAESTGRSMMRDQTRSVTGPYGKNAPFNVERFVEYKVKYSAEYEVTHHSKRTLAQFGISNPIAAGWELIPFSHVVDLMLPIGQWLSNMNALSGVSGRFYKSYKLIRQNTYEPTKGSGHWKDNYEQRYRSGSDILQTLYGTALQFPDFSLSQSLRSLTDQIATLRILRK